LQQNLQQSCSSGLRSRYGCATVRLISLFWAVVTHLLTSTYKRRFRTVDPKVEGSSPFGLVVKCFIAKHLRHKNGLFISTISLESVILVSIVRVSCIYNEVCKITIFIKLAYNVFFGCSAVVCITTTAILTFRSS